MEEAAADFEVDHYATVSVTIQRLKDNLEVDAKRARQMGELEEQLL